MENHGSPERAPCPSVCRAGGWLETTGSRIYTLVGCTNTRNSQRKMQNQMQWHPQILMLEGTSAVVQSSGSQSSLSIRSDRGNFFKKVNVCRACPEFEALIEGPGNLYALKCSQGILWLSQFILSILSMNKEGFP